jgi:hypothetical protein
MERFVDKFEHDRRLSRRHNFRTDMRIRVRKSHARELKVESKNFSPRGVFFATDLELNKGAALDLVVEMPEQITGVATAQWLCTGHVVRVVPMMESTQGGRGIGVQFDFYEASRPERPQWVMAAGHSLRSAAANAGRFRSDGGWRQGKIYLQRLRRARPSLSRLVRVRRHLDFR